MARHKDKKNYLWNAPHPMALFIFFGDLIYHIYKECVSSGYSIAQDKAIFQPKSTDSLPTSS